MRRERITISKRRGQNFLVDGEIRRRIIQAIDIKPEDEILEIGPGLGALTEDLAQAAAKVFAIEKDIGLARILGAKLFEYRNLNVITNDILQVEFEKLTPGKLKVVGNLPYYITTPIIAYLLEKERSHVKDVFITVQYEVGKRIVAQKNSRDYASLSVFAQYFTAARILFSIPKRAFYPQPKVDSVVMHLQILKQPAVAVKQQEQFFKIVRSCFNQRRKTIANSLTQRLDKQDKLTVQQILTQQGINLRARAEDLSLQDFADIERALSKKEGFRL